MIQVSSDNVATVRSPEELDAQSPVKISRFIDIDSQECKEMDEDRAFTKKLILMGFEGNGPDDPPFMYLDKNGRIWGRNPKNPSSPHYPLHFTSPRGELIGYKMSKKAAN
jgi:hypothetical protein